MLNGSRFCSLSFVLFFVIPAAADQRLINGGFEGPFVDNVAQGWTWFTTRGGASPGLETTTVHGGTQAQRIVSPPTFSDERYSGIYQVVSVAPGETYTLSAWCRMFDPSDPNPPRVPLIVVSLQGRTTWSTAQDIRVEIPNANNRWANQSIQIQTTGPQLSVWLVGWHKWPLGGGSGGFVFDDVVLDGPSPDLPTKTPTPSPTITNTPTVTPPVLGPNLLTNGGFESSFVDGLANGWSRWSSHGQLNWRENPKLGRMGAGVCGPINSRGEYCECNRSMLAMNAKFHLDIIGTGNFGMIAKQSNPEIRLIGRKFNDDLLGNRLLTMSEAQLIALGHQQAEEAYATFQNGYLAHCWTDANEQNFDNDFHRRQYLHYCLAFVRRCKELGIRSCVFSMAVGTPNNVAAMLSDEVRQVLAEADYVAYHAYGPPGTDLMMTSAPEQHAFRWRTYARWYAERGWRMPPMLYTEGTTFGGWHGRFSPGQIGQDMIAYGGEMKRDPWAVAMTVFCMADWTQGGAWNYWDVSPFFNEILNPVGAWNAQNPVDAFEGTRAQQFENALGMEMIGGIVQPVVVPTAGTYLLDTRLKWEWFPVRTSQRRPAVALALGYDPTGQTANGAAPTVVWSDELIGRLRMDTDIWYRAQWLVNLPAGTVSIWVRGSQLQPHPPVRISVDNIGLYASQGTPGPTPTPPTGSGALLSTR